MFNEYFLAHDFNRGRPDPGHLNAQFPSFNCELNLILSYREYPLMY